MRRPPRSGAEGLLSGADLLRPLCLGLTLSAGVLVLYLVALALGQAVVDARSLAVTALLRGQLLLVLMERSPSRPIWRSGPGQNRTLLIVLIGSLASLAIALYVPWAANALKLAPLSAQAW